MKLNVEQKKILTIAVGHFEKYGVHQPITVMADELYGNIDSYAPAQRSYFKSMRKLQEAGLIARQQPNSGFAVITNYGAVRAVL